MDNNYLEKAKNAQFSNKYNILIPFHFEDEQWRDITEEHVKDVRLCYMVSTYGRIYDKNANCLLRYRLTSSNVYMVRLNKNIPCKECSVSVARIIMKAFKPIQNMNNMQVWYKDNNPSNLHIDNLYWVTKSFIRNKYRDRINDIRYSDLLNITPQYGRTTNLIDPIYFEDEKWIDIDNNAVPNIQPWYMISTYGRVFSKLSGHLLKADILNSGYIRIQFRSIYNDKIDCLLHRVMMLCFCPIENSEEMQVNHKDGVKTHNYIDNLEWVTQSDNMLCSTHSDLHIRYGKSQLPSHIVHKICKGIELDLTPVEISEKILMVPYDQRLEDIVRRIKNKKNWTDISCMYNF